MNDDIDELKRDYRSITAPPYLATRIQASVADSRRRTNFWLPAAVACMAIIALVLMMPQTNQPIPDAIALPQIPSMSALAALKPSKPAMPSPSLSQLRSVSVPRMPARPMIATPLLPQTNHQIRILKEKNNAYI